jgi:hypothetical protein
MWMSNAKALSITFVTAVVYISATTPTITLLGFPRFTQDVINFLLQNTMIKHLRTYSFSPFTKTCSQEQKR